MNLYVDDLRSAPEGWALARSYEQAVAMMATTKYDIVSLDHDLGEARSGYDVMCAIERGAVLRPGDVWCHSYNPVGRKNIESAIRQWHKGSR